MTEQYGGYTQIGGELIPEFPGMDVRDLTELIGLYEAADELLSLYRMEPRADREAALRLVTREINAVESQLKYWNSP